MDVIHFDKKRLPNSSLSSFSCEYFSEKSHQSNETTQNARTRKSVHRQLNGTTRMVADNGKRKAKNEQSCAYKQQPNPLANGGFALKHGIFSVGRKYFIHGNEALAG